MDKQTVYIDFCDFGPRRVKTNEFFYRVLSERFDLKLTDNPNYIIYSHHSDLHKLHSCTKVYWTNEVLAPNWKECDYAMTCRYLDDSRHLRLPLYANWVKPEELIKEAGEGEAEKRLAEKTKFAAFFTTYDNYKVKTRVRFFHKLNARRRVDSAGRALNNIGRHIPFNHQAKLEFLRSYKFYLAFENQSVPGYVTEKLVEGMRAGCVPVYFGCPRVVEEFNPKSFLNYHDFPDEEALIERILEIDSNDDLFMQYLREPFFHGNRPNEYFDYTRILDFFERVFADGSPPLAARRRGLFGRWRLARQNRPHLSNDQ